MFGNKNKPPSPTADDIIARVQKAMAQEYHQGLYPPMIPDPRMPLTNQAGAHSHAIDAFAYAAANAGKIGKQLTPTQRAMMGVYNPGNDKDEEFFLRLIAMRMRIREGERIGADHMAVYHDMAHKKVHLMVVHNDQSVIMVEEEAIFPSDSTIAALHLMLGNPAR